MRGSSVRRRNPVMLAFVLAASLVSLAAPSLAATPAFGESVARLTRPAPGAQPLQLVLPLVADERGLKAFAGAVTTPGSPRYGRYESIAALARRFGATADHRRRVVAFLRRAGATRVRIDATGLFADATLTVSRAQRLFGTPLAEFRAARRGGTYTAPTQAIHVPSGLQGLVTGVAGLDTRPLATQPLLHTDAAQISGYQPATGTPSGCPAALAAAQGFTPSQYLTAYGYSALHQTGATGQGERVALIEIDGFRSKDISSFASCFGLRLPQINGFGVGVSRPLSPGGESTLDLEVLDAAAPGLKAIDVYETKPGTSAVLKALTAPLQNPGYKPQVISASLGLCEADTYGAAGRSAIVAAEGALAEAAASGISFLAASGDDGSSDCVNGNSSSSPPAPVLAVNYPASSPWVTGVGGTNLVLNADNSIQSQVVWNDGYQFPGAAGGGGLSALFTRPSYQKGTVSPNRRAVPDVALLADIAPGYDVYCSASPDCVNADNTNPWQTVGGTSAATPLLAGGLAIVDQELRAHQRQDLGLVNPLLYEIGRNAGEAASVLNDVTAGSNDVGPWIAGYGRALGCCTAGPGFDEASGWGGVNLAALAVVALARQPKIVNVSLSLPGRQHPVRNRHLLATVGCSGRCLAGAYAQVTIGRKRAFTSYSDLHAYRRAGRHTIKIAFSKSQLSKLRTALRHHSRIEAAVVGAIVDAGGNIEKRTAGRKLRITS